MRSLPGPITSTRSWWTHPGPSALKLGPVRRDQQADPHSHTGGQGPGLLSPAGVRSPAMRGNAASQYMQA